MSEKIQDQDTDSEPEDNRSFEEKFKDFVKKIKPYKERIWAVRKKFLIKQSTKFLTIKGNLFSSFIL